MSRGRDERGRRVGAGQRRSGRWWGDRGGGSEGDGEEGRDWGEGNGIEQREGARKEEREDWERENRGTGEQGDRDRGGGGGGASGEGRVGGGWRVKKREGRAGESEGKDRRKEGGSDDTSRRRGGVRKDSGWSGEEAAGRKVGVKGRDVTKRETRGEGKRERRERGGGGGRDEDSEEGGGVEEEWEREGSVQKREERKAREREEGTVGAKDVVKAEGEKGRVGGTDAGGRGVERERGRAIRWSGSAGGKLTGRLGARRGRRREERGRVEKGGESEKTGGIVGQEGLVEGRGKRCSAGGGGRGGERTDRWVRNKGEESRAAEEGGRRGVVRGTGGTRSDARGRESREVKWKDKRYEWGRRGGGREGGDEGVMEWGVRSGEQVYKKRRARGVNSEGTKQVGRRRRGLRVVSEFEESGTRTVRRGDGRWGGGRGGERVVWGEVLRSQGGEGSRAGATEWGTQWVLCRDSGEGREERIRERGSEEGEGEGRGKVNVEGERRSGKRGRRGENREREDRGDKADEGREVGRRGRVGGKKRGEQEEGHARRATGRKEGIVERLGLRGSVEDPRKRKDVEVEGSRVGGQGGVKVSGVSLRKGRWNAGEAGQSRVRREMGMGEECNGQERWEKEEEGDAGGSRGGQGEDGERERGRRGSETKREGGSEKRRWKRRGRKVEAGGEVSMGRPGRERARGAADVEEGGGAGEKGAGEGRKTEQSSEKVSGRGEETGRAGRRCEGDGEGFNKTEEGDVEDVREEWRPGRQETRLGSEEKRGVGRVVGGARGGSTRTVRGGRARGGATSGTGRTRRSGSRGDKRAERAQWETGLAVLSFFFCPHIAFFHLPYFSLFSPPSFPLSPSYFYYCYPLLSLLLLLLWLFLTFFLLFSYLHPF
ncbi:hypothetical protein Tco_0341688 [Tanacetum coccineum]